MPAFFMGRKARQKQTRVAAVETVSETASPVVIDWTSRDWIIIAVLVALTLIVFGQVASHAFLNFDDGQFIYENQHVLHGDVAWALTSAETGWYPLTWLSHMLDTAIWGQRAGMHLLTGVVLHALSAVFLFLALRLLTRAPWPSAFVAALFAIHPMHVESVAWASERKDTLSTLFAMLALWLYARAPRRMLPISIALALSLMAKQMYITLPFVFLLLDGWPLDRLHTADDLRRRIAEKWPLFVLTVAGGIAAFIGQSQLKAMQSMTSLPITDRIANALIACVRYLGKLFVPIDMALPYPLTRVSLVSAIVPFLVLAAITIAAIIARRSAPYLLTGWLWLLGTLVPVIGIVAIGNQSMADRYTYFSYIGLFIAIAFGAINLKIPAKALATIGGGAIVVYAAIAFHQVRYWKDSETLFTHTLAVTRDNSVAEYLLGQSLQSTKPDQAIVHLRRSIALTEPVLQQPNAIAPDWYPQAYVGIGTSMLMKARSMPQSPARDTMIRDAITGFGQALAIDSNAAHAKNNMGVAMQMLPPDSPTALQLSYDAHLNKGTVFSQQGRYDEAAKEFRSAASIFPRSIEARIYLGLGLLQANKKDEGLAALREAKSIDAKQANEFLTKALHLPASDANLDGFVEQAAR